VINRRDIASWLKRHPRRRRWLASVISGVLIELLLVILAPTWSSALFIRDGSWSLDGMIRGVASIPALQLPLTREPSLVMIDVDETTWRSPQWGGGEPFRAPRPELAELITRAFAYGAQYIIVDVAIEGHLTDTEDVAFASSLESLLHGLRAGVAPHGPKRLILVRSLRPRLTPRGPDMNGLPELRASAVDRVIAQSGGLIVAAAPYFVKSSDGVLREWQLWRVACTPALGGETGRMVIMPSAQLLIATWEDGPVGDSAAPWRNSAPGACPSPDDPAAAAAQAGALSVDTLQWLRQNASIPNLKTAELAAAQITTASSDTADPPVSNHIVYRIYDRVQTPARPGDPLDAGFARVSAATVLGTPPSASAPWRARFAGATVVIGQSHSDAGDVLVTPLGLMSGSLVIINSVDSILRYGVLGGAPELSIHLPFTLLAVLLTATILACWRGTLATLGSGALVMVLSLLISVYCLIHLGVWFDFLAPLGGTLLGAVWEVWQAAREEPEGSGLHVANLAAKALEKELT
jgi:CHASE2 domain-containing sensor protein